MNPITSQPVNCWRSNEVYKELLLSGIVLTLMGPHNYVYKMFDYMAPGTRRIGRWRILATSNGRFYLVPSLATKTIEMCGPWNGHTTLADEGAGIVATLFGFVGNPILWMNCTKRKDRVGPADQISTAGMSDLKYSEQRKNKRTRKGGPPSPPFALYSAAYGVAV